MDANKRDFDTAATTWDEKPQRVKLAREIGQAMLRAVPFDAQMNVLDYGCGTGLLTLQLQPLVRTIVGADTSRGMLEVFNAKLAAAGIDNGCSMYLDPEREESWLGRYDAIVSAMTLHHVERIDHLLHRFRAALHPGGYLCLADLDLDGGRFHDDPTGVFHNGFSRSELTVLLLAAGFVDVETSGAASIDKIKADGSSERFTVFLAVARRE